MRKYCIVLALMLLATCSLRAQDTLYSKQPPANYHVGCNWPQFEKTASYGYTSCDTRFFSEWAVSCITDTQLTVYGLAAILCTERTDPGLRISYFDGIADTATHIYEYFRVYEYVSNTSEARLEQVSEDMRWQEVETPVAYYLNTGLEKPYGGHLPVFPVFELYLQTPVVVSDTFFIGHTVTFGDHIDSSHYSWRTCHLIDVNFVKYHTGIPVCEAINSIAAWSPGWAFCGFNVTFDYFYFFPILTPNHNPDTTGVDTTGTTVDTLTIGATSLVERYTSVFPNPAHGSTRVLSSYGLTKVEVYAVDGRKVEELRPTGYSADIDVSQWPSGEYLLHITTRQGTVTRKLLVR